MFTGSRTMVADGTAVMPSFWAAGVTMNSSSLVTSSCLLSAMVKMSVPSASVPAVPSGPVGGATTMYLPLTAVASIVA